MPDTMPKEGISVIIPAYNERQTIADCVESALAELPVERVTIEKAPTI